jgi:branched-chain amino acid transport system permease protein
LGGLVVALLATVPWWGSAVLVQFGINALILATLAQSWNIIGGYTGYPSFGNSVFYGLGGYGVAIAMVQYGLPFPVGMAIGVGLAGAFAILLGLPVLRLRGHYFAIATLGLAEVMTAIVSNLEIAGRNVGLILPLVKGDAMFFELALALLVVATLTVRWISRSRFGFALIAIRENEQAAAVMGVNTTLYKILAFALCSVFAAIAGGIHAYWITYLDPGSAFDVTLNIKMIIMAVFGGAGTIFGPVLGAFVLSAISEILATKVTSLASIFFGIVIVAAIVFMPRGFADFVRHFRHLGWRYLQENMRTYRV